MSYAQIGSYQIPAQFAGGLARYVLARIPTGGFLRAVLENDLSEAVGRGDDQALAYLPNIVRVVYNHVPVGARRDNVSDWLSARGNPEFELEDAAVKNHYAGVWEEWISA